MFGWHMVLLFIISAAWLFFCVYSAPSILNWILEIDSNLEMYIYYKV